MELTVDDTGDEALQSAIKALEFADGLNKDFKIQLKVSETNEALKENSEDKHGQAPTEDKNSQQDTSQAHVGDTPKEQIQAGTSYHSALRAVSEVEQRGDDEIGVSSNEANEVADIKLTTLRPALKELVDRGLLERREVDEGRTKFRYVMTDWGEQMLNELEDE